MSQVGPKADKMLRRHDCQLCANHDQHSAALRIDGEPHGGKPPESASGAYAGGRIANSAVGSAENILRLRCPPNSETSPGAAVLNLICQAADLVRGIDDDAAERQARAETLAKQAIEKLEIAEARARSAESGRLAAEAETKEFSDRLQKVENV